MKLCSMNAQHWPEVRAIYEAGISTGNATFVALTPRGPSWNKAHLPHSRLVALDASNRVLGWAALAAVCRRDAYRGVAEVSVYVAGPAQGQGIGRALLAALVSESEGHGIWTLQAILFPENEPAYYLCRGAGFREVGRHERVGQLHGIWRDTLQLERRSQTVGTTNLALFPVSKPLVPPTDSAPLSPHNARKTMGMVTFTHTG